MEEHIESQRELPELTDEGQAVEPDAGGQGPLAKRAHDVEIVTLQNRLGKQTVFHISMGILILLKTIGAY